MISSLCYHYFDSQACTHVNDNGVCKQECPPMHRYNPVKYLWEKNPEGKYAYGSTCIKDCPKHLLKNNGACVEAHPPMKTNVNGKHIPCNGSCPKICHFSDTVHAGNIDSLENCTIVEGSITILDSSFKGFQEVFDNYTFGRQFPPLDPSKLEVFATLKEVTGYLNIQADIDGFSNLSAFRNLEIIGGQATFEFFSSLYIVKTSLTSLGLSSLHSIRSGGISILENKHLCYAGNINWDNIIDSPNHNTFLQNNRNAHECILEGKTCDTQCSGDGCWGPGPKACLSCRNYQMEGKHECVNACRPEDGLFQSEDGQCIHCHSECKLTCFGPDPDQCHACKGAYDGTFCVDKCPPVKYKDPSTGECIPCNKNCIKGCTGPGNHIGQGGCNSCTKAIINTDSDRIRCLQEDEVCPEGHYMSVPPSDLAAKTLCRPCHPLCSSCSGYGFHRDVCDTCMSLQENEYCTTKCSFNSFDNGQGLCKPCHLECRGGCNGSRSSDCHACKNYRILADGSYMDNEKKLTFRCAAKCPNEAPHTVTIPGKDPYCSSEKHLVSSLPGLLSLSTLLSGIAICIGIIGLFIFLLCWQKQRRAKFEENTAKIMMIMSGFNDTSESLIFSNTPPNTAELKVIKETELRKGSILGHGAFGTVYKGIWLPDGDNVKIPVAIKVLKEGTSADANNKLLKESYHMATVNHPHVLQLLAICMKSEILLVTELMPLGCLLDYVQNNRTKIGSFTLLTWCKQIAQGMAHLEEKHVIHRDLAARNVLVQRPNCVKITDFGLACILDCNEDKYFGGSGCLPIKWLALECLTQRIFTHKSDVWAFGVTVWELLTYGESPYSDTPVREILDKLEKGERLEQPSIATTDIYYILIKCWLVNADARPNFVNLANEFENMLQDPGHYLVIPNDNLMHLPNCGHHDHQVLINGLGRNLSGANNFFPSEENFNPEQAHRGSVGVSTNTLSTHVGTPMRPSKPTQKLFSSGMMCTSYLDAFTRQQQKKQRHAQRNGLPISVNEEFNTLSSQSLHCGTNIRYTSCDPLLLQPKSTLVPSAGPSSLSMSRPIVFPIDDEDYLLPTPKSCLQKQQQAQQQHQQQPSWDNLEYLSNQGRRLGMHPLYRFFKVK